MHPAHYDALIWFKRKKKRKQNTLDDGYVTDLDKPVDGAAVDKRGEHTTARAESIPHWTHTQHDVQLLSDTRDEELEDLSTKSDNSALYNAYRWMDSLEIIE